MRGRVLDLVKRGDGLFSQRSPLLSLWQQIAENFHVLRADMTRNRFMSEEFASFLMTGRPAMAHRDLSNLLPALMRPRDRQWLWARTDDKRLNEDRECRAYLDWMSEQQFALMYSQRSGLVRSAKEVDGDYVAFGQGVFTVDPNSMRNGLLVRSWHLKDVVWTEDDELQINQVHHRRTPAARDVDRLWPKTRSPKVLEMLKDEPDRQINCRRIVIPAGDYDLPVKNKDRTPFVCIYVDVDHETILEETAVRRRGYVIPRWARLSGSQYAYSMACIYALPDARMAQQIALTMLEASQKATDPPLVAAYEAIQGGVNYGAGMITWSDPDYDERTGEVLRPLPLNFDGIRYGAAREERVDALIDSQFFLNQLRMPQITKDMTAYEASKVYEQFTVNSLPLLEPVEVDYNGALCAECYEVSSDLSLLGSPYDVPQALQGRELRWEFDTPLKAASEQKKVFTFAQVVDTVAKGMQVDPDVSLEVDWSKGTREAVIGTGGADWLRDPKAVTADKKQKAQAVQAAQTAQMLAHGADAASRIGEAVSNTADARQAMQNSGALS